MEQRSKPIWKTLGEFWTCLFFFLSISHSLCLHTITFPAVAPLVAQVWHHLVFVFGAPTSVPHGVTLHVCRNVYVAVHVSNQHKDNTLFTFSCTFLGPEVILQEYLLICDLRTCKFTRGCAAENLSASVTFHCSVMTNPGDSERKRDSGSRNCLQTCLQLCFVNIHNEFIVYVPTDFFFFCFFGVF